MKNTIAFSTKEDLEKHRDACLKNTEIAILNHPDEYQEIKKLLTYVVSNMVDISEYDDIAKSLSDLLEAMGRDTIFYHYFHENINPHQYGTPKHLRFFCRDLLDQLTELNKWRLRSRNIAFVHDPQ